MSSKSITGSSSSDDRFQIPGLTGGRKEGIKKYSDGKKNLYARVFKTTFKYEAPDGKSVRLNKSSARKFIASLPKTGAEVPKWYSKKSVYATYLNSLHPKDPTATSAGSAPASQQRSATSHARHAHQQTPPTPTPAPASASAPQTRAANQGVSTAPSDVKAKDFLPIYFSNENGEYSNDMHQNYMKGDSFHVKEGSYRPSSAIGNQAVERFEQAGGKFESRANPSDFKKMHIGAQLEMFRMSTAELEAAQRDKYTKNYIDSIRAKQLFYLDCVLQNEASSPNAMQFKNEAQKMKGILFPEASSRKDSAAASSTTPSTPIPGVPVKPGAPSASTLTVRREAGGGHQSPTASKTPPRPQSSINPSRTTSMRVPERPRSVAAKPLSENVTKLLNDELRQEASFSKSVSRVPVGGLKVIYNPNAKVWKGIVKEFEELDAVQVRLKEILVKENRWTDTSALKISYYYERGLSEEQILQIFNGAQFEQGKSVEEVVKGALHADQRQEKVEAALQGLINHFDADLNWTGNQQDIEAFQRTLEGLKSKNENNEFFYGSAYRTLCQMWTFHVINVSRERNIRSDSPVGQKLLRGLKAMNGAFPFDSSTLGVFYNGQTKKTMAEFTGQMERFLEDEIGLFLRPYLAGEIQKDQDDARRIGLSERLVSQSVKKYGLSPTREQLDHCADIYLKKSLGAMIETPGFITLDEKDIYRIFDANLLERMLSKDFPEKAKTLREMGDVRRHEYIRSFLNEHFQREIRRAPSRPLNVQH